MHGFLHVHVCPMYSHVQIVNVPIAVAYLFEGGDLAIVGGQVHVCMSFEV